MTVPLVLIRPVARRWLSAGELQRRFVDLQPAGAMTGTVFLPCSQHATSLFVRDLLALLDLVSSVVFTPAVGGG